MYLAVDDVVNREVGIPRFGDIDKDVTDSANRRELRKKYIELRRIILERLWRLKRKGEDRCRMERRIERSTQESKLLTRL